MIGVGKVLTHTGIHQSKSVNLALIISALNTSRPHKKLVLCCNVQELSILRLEQRTDDFLSKSRIAVISNS